MTGFDPIQQLWITGRELYRACHSGSVGPGIVQLRERMTHPQVGDLVIEFTSFRGYDPDGIGWLRDIEYQDPGRPEPDLVERYVIEPLHRPGEEQVWRNAQFIAIAPARGGRFLRQGVSA